MGTLGLLCAGPIALATCDLRCHRRREQPTVWPRSGNSSGLDCGPSSASLWPWADHFLSLYLCLHSENRVTSKVMSISRGTAVWPLPGRLLLFLCYLGTGQRLLSRMWRGDVVSTNHPWNVVRGAEDSETGMVKGWTGMMCSSHPPPLEKAEKVNSTPHMPQVMSKNLLEESSFAWVLFK